MGKLRHKNMSNLDTNVGAEQPSAPVLKTCLSHLTIVAGMEEVREELKFQEILSKHEREPWAPESLWWQGLENAGRKRWENCKRDKQLSFLPRPSLLSAYAALCRFSWILYTSAGREDGINTQQIPLHSACTPSTPAYPGPLHFHTMRQPQGREQYLFWRYFEYKMICMYLNMFYPVWPLRCSMVEISMAVKWQGNQLA